MTHARTLAGLGAAAGLMFGCAILLIGASSPGYDAFSQFISELGARGAPTRWWMNGLGIIPFGVLLALSGVGRCALREPVSGVLLVLAGAGFVLAGVFPCDRGCSFEQMSASAIVHNQAAFGAFLMSSLAAGVIAVPKLFRRQWRRGIVALLGGLSMMLSLGAMIRLGLDSAWVGLAQRGFVFSLCLWLILDSLILVRAGRDTA